MRIKIRCFSCGKEHKNTDHNFPKQVREIVEVKGENGVVEKVQKVVGYICRGCILKQMLKDMKNENSRKGKIVKI